ncbi:hypothetical protein [Pseudomonas fluorescens]|uniref:hypothetical protein n=1 Tax=Pseudomonas fluorescens TaxID=294 RepID=UPI0037FB9865
MTTTTHARLNYFHDTLFGPIAKSVDCNITLTAITPEAYKLRVIHPVPDDLHKSHSLTIFLTTSQHLTGAISHAKKMDNGDLELHFEI